MQTYLDACERLGREPGRMAIRKDVFIAESHDAATEVGDELIAAGYRGMGRGAVAYGDPDSVAEQLAVFGPLGFTDVIIRTMAVPQPAAVASIELSGRVRELLASA
jgi:alkanesulfonate monooxygenase SsuD/methylene tetrahydromethanopterin reductase-like flavin-dependent oxidoreductase (luciferase family)